MLFWCSGYIGAKYGLPHSGTFAPLFWRYALVLVAAAAIITFRREWQRPDMGVFNTGFLVHFFWLVVTLKSFEFGISAGAAALLAAMQPGLAGLAMRRETG